MEEDVTQRSNPIISSYTGSTPCLILNTTHQFTTQYQIRLSIESVIQIALDCIYCNYSLAMHLSLVLAPITFNCVMTIYDYHHQVIGVSTPQYSNSWLWLLEGFKNWVWMVYQYIISAWVHWRRWLSMSTSELIIIFINGRMQKFYTDKHERSILKLHYTMILIQQVGMLKGILANIGMDAHDCCPGNYDLVQ